MSPAHVVPFFVVTTAAGKAVGSYNTRQGVGTKLRFTPDARAFHWAPETGLVEVTETFWWGCFNASGWNLPDQAGHHIPGRIYRGQR